MSETISQGKQRMIAWGGLDPGENLAEGLARIPVGVEPPERPMTPEQSRMKAVLQAGRECHDCSCYSSPPCEECVECVVCNPCWTCDTQHDVPKNDECHKEMAV